VDRSGGGLFSGIKLLALVSPRQFSDAFSAKGGFLQGYRLAKESMARKQRKDVLKKNHNFS
jgi:hypothetical protein